MKEKYNVIIGAEAVAGLCFKGGFVAASGHLFECF